MAAKPRFDGEWMKLGELTSLVSRKNKTGQCGAVYSVTNSQGFIPSTEYFSKEVFSKELKTYKLVGRNQIAYNPSRINVGSVALQDREDEVVVSPLYVVFSVDQERLDPAYLLRFLKSGPGLSQIAFQSIGTVRNNLKYDGLSNILLHVPPLEEQRLRIRALVSLEGRIETCRSFLSRLDALVKSRFVEMFDGKGYPTSSVSTLVSSMRNGLSPSKSGSYRSKVLTLSAITQGRFDPLAWKEGFFSEEPPANKRVSDEDFYICRGNGNIHLVGTGEYSSVSMEDAVFPDTMIALKLKRERIILPFLRCAWNQISTRKQIEASAKTTNGTFKINQAALGNIELPVPPLELQLEFADFVAEVDKSRFVVQQQIEKLQMLYDSLAQEYFS